MVMQLYWNYIRDLLRPLGRVVDTLLPPRCIGTGEIVSAQGMISPDLWAALNFIGAPFCTCCGKPFELNDELSDDALCAPCIETPPRFDRARSVMTYNDASRKLLLRFKYGDQQHAAITFAGWIKNCDIDHIATIDFIVPVPLHWRRLWQRRFNQSALLANALSKQIKKPVIHALARRRFTSTQKGLSRRERLKNVRMAFICSDKYKDKIKGRNIALIDDVLTSGATVSECAKLLKRNGAKSVSVYTIARVMHEPEFYPIIDEFNVLDEGY